MSAAAIATAALVGFLGIVVPAGDATPSRPGAPAAAAAAGLPVQAVPSNQAPTSAVALAADPTGFSHGFYRGQDDAVYQRTFRDGAWSAQSSLGGRIVGAPSAALARTTLVVAGRGTNGAVYVRMASQGSWGPWTNLGGRPSAAPVVIGGADGRIDIYIRGHDDALWARRRPAGSTSWTDWTSLGGRLVTGPAAVATATGASVFGIGTDHAVWYRNRTSTWSAWASLGGRSYSAPAAAWSSQNGTTSLLIRGTSDALYLRQRTGSSWGGWRNLGGLMIDAPGAAGLGGGTAGIDVAVRGRDNAVWTTVQRNGAWSAFTRAWAPAAPAPPPASRLGTDWTRIPTSSRVVALTFDAGANADAVASIRSTLQRSNVPATFFLTGQWVRSFPAQANEIAAGGFVVGNHSDTHPELTTLSTAQVQSQVVNAQQSILHTNGVDSRPLFRFPFGDVDSRVLGVVNDLGYVSVRWTVDTLGWQGTSGGRSVQSVIDRVLGSLQPGEIVLMHVGSHPTDRSMLDAAALPQLISAIRARGYGFVTLDALVG